MHKAIFSLHFTPHTIVSIQVVWEAKSNVCDSTLCLCVGFFSNGAQQLNKVHYAFYLQCILNANLMAFFK